MLTLLYLKNYSGFMDAELKSLEDKIDQLVAMYKDACSENIKLQQQLTDAIATNKQLSEKIHIAVNRLQLLLKNIPENSNEY